MKYKEDARVGLYWVLGPMIGYFMAGARIGSQ
jgi:hypothetical protein